MKHLLYHTDYPARITWIFFEEGKEDAPQFEIQARNFEEAFDLAYEEYGPQVDDLYYKPKES